MIDFNTMQEAALGGFKGGEGTFYARMIADENNRFIRGRLEPGASIGLHTHEGNSEIIYVLSGTGTAILDGTEETLTAGQAHYCPMGHTHTLLNRGTEDLIFFAVVPQHPTR